MEHRVGLQKELRNRGVSLNTPITSDTYEILLTKDSLLNITNRISAIIKRQLTAPEVTKVVQFVRKLPETKYYQKSLGDVQNIIAHDYVTRYKLQQRSIEDQEDIDALVGVDKDTDDGSLQDYQKKELGQLSRDENNFKIKTFADRRGNAIVDRDRAEGRRSSPDNIPPAKPSDVEVKRATVEGMKAISQFLDTESFEDLLGRQRNSYLTFDNVALPHQILQFDSRNRRVTNYKTNEYTWYIHPAGKPGQLGDVRTQDTLQQIIAIKICPFWLPISSPLDIYYNKVRMLIKEFQDQSIQVTEFLDPSMHDPTSRPYHFEFEIKELQFNRVYLVPCKSTYVFRRPYAQLNNLTIMFYYPFEPLTLQPDRGTFTMTFGNPTLFTTIAPDNLATGDLVYITNANTGDSDLDAELNRQQGQIITRLDDFNFTVQVDTSSIAGSQNNVDVYYGAKRIFFQMEFTCLEQ